MPQRQTETQHELLTIKNRRDELARQQHYEGAAYNRDKEYLLHRELARLRLKLSLRRALEKE